MVSFGLHRFFYTTSRYSTVLSVQDDLRACYGSLANVDLDYALCQ